MENQKQIWVKGTNDKLVNVTKADQVRVVAVEPPKDPAALPGAPPAEITYKLISVTGGGPLALPATLAKGSEAKMKSLLLHIQMLLGAHDLDKVNEDGTVPDPKKVQN